MPAVIPFQHQHWLYVWIPLFGAFIWFGTLWAMLITWLASGRPKYVSQDGKIAYISDVGADILKPLFIVACVITGVSFFLALSIERWLRHSGRLVANMRRRERVLSSLAIIGAFIGGAGLILLSIFDTKRHTRLHRGFLLIFIVGVGLSAIFSVLEYRWLSRDFIEIRKLKIAYVVKGAVAGILILLAVAFAVTLFKAPDVGAIFEWLIAFGYTFYLLTFFWDLRMAKGVHSGELSRQRLLAMRGGAAMAEVNKGAGNIGPAPGVATGETTSTTAPGAAAAPPAHAPPANGHHPGNGAAQGNGTAGRDGYFDPNHAAVRAANDRMANTKMTGYAI